MDEDTLRTMIVDNLFVDEDINEILENYKIKTNLDAVILSLETQQKEKYDSIRSISLSYLNDIRNNSIPSSVLKALQNSSSGITKEVKHYG